MNRAILVSLSMMYSVFTLGQGLINDLGKVGNSPNVDFRTVRDSGDAYFVANHDSSEGGAYAKFERWKTFWEDRVYSSHGNPGSFNHSQIALASSLADPVCTGTGLNPTPWVSLGPDENIGTGTPNLGMVTAVKLILE